MAYISFSPAVGDHTSLVLMGMGVPFLASAHSAVLLRASISLALNPTRPACSLQQVAELGAWTLGTAGMYMCDASPWYVDCMPIPNSWEQLSALSGLPKQLLLRTVLQGAVNPCDPKCVRCGAEFGLGAEGAAVGAHVPQPAPPVTLNFAVCCIQDHRRVPVTWALQRREINARV